MPMGSRSASVGVFLITTVMSVEGVAETGTGGVAAVSGQLPEGRPRWLMLAALHQDREASWVERKTKLTELANAEADRWTADFLLCIACGEASFEGNLEAAIDRIRALADSHGDFASSVQGWTATRGCVVDESHKLLMASRPFGAEVALGHSQLEVLRYAQHLEEAPVTVRDVALLIVAGMTLARGDTLGAIAAHEQQLDVPSETLRDLARLDREAAASEYGHYIANQFPAEMEPVWRPQYSAAMRLTALYEARGDSARAIQMAEALATAVSHDGWFPSVNLVAARKLSQLGSAERAQMQYDLALSGLSRRIEKRIRRKAELFELGFLAKGPDFVSWEDEVLNQSGWQAVLDGLAGEIPGHSE